MRYIKITRSESDNAIIVSREHLLDEINAEFLDQLDDEILGDSLILTTVEMSEQAFDELEEFNGW